MPRDQGRQHGWHHEDGDWEEKERIPRRMPRDQGRPEQQQLHQHHRHNEEPVLGIDMEPGGAAEQLHHHSYEEQHGWHHEDDDDDDDDDDADDAGARGGTPRAAQMMLDEW